jgi:hypothetical protein
MDRFEASGQCFEVKTVTTSQGQSEKTTRFGFGQSFRRNLKHSKRMHLRTLKSGRMICLPHQWNYWMEATEPVQCAQGKKKVFTALEKKRHSPQ